MTVAKISACIITAGEPTLEAAVASIRPFVAEVCLVCTREATIDDLLRFGALADHVVITDRANDEHGQIADFAAARNASFALATQPWILWLDSDDVVDGAEHLAEAIRIAEERNDGRPQRLLFPYEYAYDAQGRCISRQTRERLVTRGAFEWRRPVHESLMPKPGVECQDLLDGLPPIVWKHRRDHGARRADPNRDLRILKRYLDGEGKNDPRAHYDFGCALAAAGLHLPAARHLAYHVEASGWDEERAVACLKLVEMCSFWPGQEDQARMWAQRAASILPVWPAAHFATARVEVKAAQRATGDLRDRLLARAAVYAERGLALPDLPTLAGAHNPEERADAARLLGDTYAALGRHAQASASYARALELRPDPALALAHIDALRAAYPLAPVGSPDIVIACAHTVEAWDPAKAAAEGIGGSETAVIEVARRLAAYGARVRVFCRCGSPGLYDGVEYRAADELSAVKSCDLLIAWRDAVLLAAVPARVRWLWVHDVDAANASPWPMHLADRVLALSEWHAAHLAKLHPGEWDKIICTRNGIDLARFVADVERNPHRVIYSSSPDRGLAELLALWPAVRARVPNAELHVFYGAAAFAEHPFATQLAATPGVVYRGRVDQRELAREMLAAGVWVHPSWAGDQPFTETSCIGAMEAQVAGCRLVCGDHGALPETAAGATFVHGDPRTPETQALWVDAIVEAMTGGCPASRMAADRFSWDGVAKQWLEMATVDLERWPAVVPSRRDARPVLHMVLGPQASGEVIIDANAPGGESAGGGSRAGFLGLARAMDALGCYRVRAFSTFRDEIVSRDGVEYVRLDKLPLYAPPDVLFAYYDTAPLKDAAPGVLRIASHHTYAPYMAFDHADVNTAPSQHAMQRLRDAFDPLAPWYVLPNGVEAPLVRPRPVDGRVVYHTSPDRGLHLLLAMWPTIRRRVPHATLHVVGPVEEVCAMADPPGVRGERLRRLRAALAEARTAGGLVLRGRLPRTALEVELSEASAFAFPCSVAAPCETFSVSVMECLAMGLPVVLAPADALGSIYEGAVRMTPAPVEEHLGDFEDALVDVLANEVARTRLSALGKSLAARFTFARQADVLDRIIRGRLAVPVARKARAADRHAVAE